VVDTVPPVFSPPADTLLACGAPTDTSSTGTPPADTLYLDCVDAGNLNITGQPTNLMDQCDTTVTSFYQSNITDIICQNTYTIERSWYVQDGCMNTDSFLQIIYVQDTLPPTFTQQAQDMTIDCSQDMDQAFNDWLANLAQAQAGDICTPDSLLIWQVENADGSTPPSLPAPCQGYPAGVFTKHRSAFAKCIPALAHYRRPGGFPRGHRGPPALPNSGACTADHGDL